MKHRNPPRIATLLLTRLSNCDDALVGDMVEEYRRGRSRSWYWRQTSIAVLRTTVADIRSHPLLALRAFVLMVACVLCYQYCLLRPLGLFASDVLWWLRWSSPLFFFGLRYKLLAFTFGTLIGVLAPCMGYIIGARIVARLHRSHQAAFTLLNAALVLFVGMLELLWFVEHNPRHLQWFPFSVYYRVPLLLLFVMSTLLGGFWKLKSRTHSGT